MIKRQQEKNIDPYIHMYTYPLFYVNIKQTLDETDAIYEKPRQNSTLIILY